MRVGVSTGKGLQVVTIITLYEHAAISLAEAVTATVEEDKQRITPSQCVCVTNRYRRLTLQFLSDYVKEKCIFSHLHPACGPGKHGWRERPPPLGRGGPLDAQQALRGRRL